MTTRATLADFPVGVTVKVVHIPKSHWLGTDFLGAIGDVVGYYEQDNYVRVSFDPKRWSDQIFRPWWLERGHIEWIKDEASE